MYILIFLYINDDSLFQGLHVLMTIIRLAAQCMCGTSCSLETFRPLVFFRINPKAAEACYCTNRYLSLSTPISNRTEKHHSTYITSNNAPVIAQRQLIRKLHSQTDSNDTLIATNPTSTRMVQRVRDTGGRLGDDGLRVGISVLKPMGPIFNNSTEQELTTKI